MEPAAEHQQQLRSLRDFLLVYNRLTELCFQHCVCSLNHRLLTGQEERCLDACAGKLLRSNHRLLRAYVGLMPPLLQRRAASAAPQGPPALPTAPPGAGVQGTPPEGPSLGAAGAGL